MFKTLDDTNTPVFKQLKLLPGISASWSLTRVQCETQPYFLRYAYTLCQGHEMCGIVDQLQGLRELPYQLSTQHVESKIRRRHKPSEIVQPNGNISDRIISRASRS